MYDTTLYFIYGGLSSILMVFPSALEKKESLLFLPLTVILSNSSPVNQLANFGAYQLLSELK